MNKKIIAIILILISIAIITLLLLLPTNQKSNKNLIVATTIQPIYSITTEITKNTNTQVINIIPPNANPHSFEPTIQDKAKLANSDIIFYIRGDFDEWILNINKNSNLIDLSKNIEIKDNNPHYWLSLNNAKIIAEEIKNTLILQDRNNELVYQKNYREYIKTLDSLKTEYELKFKDIKNKNIITYHPAFNYLIEEFNLNLLTTVIKDERSQLTAKKIVELKDLVHQNNIKVIYVTNQVPEQTRDSLEEKLEITTVLLDPIGTNTDRQNYTDMIRYNLETILANN